jgi:hypothetical protein
MNATMAYGVQATKKVTKDKNHVIFIEENDEGKC